MRKAGKENKRNQLKRFLAAAGAAALAVSFTPGAVWAQGDYTYSLTLYAGNQGAFTGDLSWVIPYSQGEAQVSLEGDKVVVRGLCWISEVFMMPIPVRLILQMVLLNGMTVKLARHQKKNILP